MHALPVPAATSCAEAVEPGLAATADRPHEATSGGRILVVEDDPDVAEVAAVVLEGFGYTTSLAPDADVAARMLADDQDFVLVFSDIRMPGSMNGIGLAEHLAARYPEIPVLLATGYSAAEGASRFPLLAKPYTVQQLKTWVTHLTKAKH